MPIFIPSIHTVLPATVRKSTYSNAAWISCYPISGFPLFSPVFLYENALKYASKFDRMFNYWNSRHIFPKPKLFNFCSRNNALKSFPLHVAKKHIVFLTYFPKNLSF
jgi:hypothetical protein